MTRGAAIRSAACVDDERDLVGRCVRGEPGAWAALVREYEPRVRRVVSGSAAGEDAADLRQEVWARLLASDAAALRRFRGADARALRSFIGAIARSVAIDHLRARGARVPGSGGDEPEFLPDEAPTPELALGAEQVKRGLARALEAAAREAGQPGRDGDILRLHFQEGLSATEIAAMGIGLQARGVEAVLRRAKARIERLLWDDEKP